MSEEPIQPVEGQEPLFEGRTDLGPFKDAISRIEHEIGKIIVGQQDMIQLMITALLSNGHILIEGVPGVAKTLAAKLLAKSLDVAFSRIQFTPDMMPADVLGTTVFNNQSGSFEFRPGPIFSQIVLIDEINRAPAKTQAALFEVMEERQITIDGQTHPMKPPFIVIATQNPIEQEGTYRLPEAQLDRFLFKIDVGYPSAEDEVKILSDYHARKNTNELDSIQAVIGADDIQRLQNVVRLVHIEHKLIQYIVNIIQQTRGTKDLYLGASPRASINIMTAAKAFAAMQGRDFVIPEDVQTVAPSVLRHRVILTPEKEMEGATAASIVRQLMAQVEVPR